MSKNPPSKAIINKFEKRALEIQEDLKNHFQQLANFVNTKYESTSGQIYFKMDLINKEIAELKGAIVDLSNAFKTGLTAIAEEQDRIQHELVENVEKVLEAIESKKEK